MIGRSAHDLCGYDPQSALGGRADQKVTRLPTARLPTHAAVPGRQPEAQWGGERLKEVSQNPQLHRNADRFYLPVWPADLRMRRTIRLVSPVTDVTRTESSVFLAWHTHRAVPALPK